MGKAEREREVIRQSRDAIESLTILLGSLSVLAEDLEQEAVAGKEINGDG